ncbi:hypothetical protein COCMIDRAFT_8019 [Bipolaris oryzae ATCC 44560]|uniref:Uncharacterized protein n=1 Tax=Bipolaris oryzae ATCC 44560 TaxID=930090 RepID=W6ZFT5_COCMI|nr:uncharacterized protein COCMIDRAFT_8019 [Bipolaris oryzae ATCC 44560]EUC42371.1 hypothetical protein COCMIDRAFT_8019 [Bipolaris oryzae ATCC 44560]
MAPPLRPILSKGKNQRLSHSSTSTQGSPSVSQPQHTQLSGSPTTLAPEPQNPAVSDQYYPSTGGFSIIQQPQPPTRASQEHAFSFINTTQTTFNAPASGNITSNAPATTRTIRTAVSNSHTTSTGPTSTYNAPIAPAAPRVPTSPQPTAEELRKRREARRQELRADISANYRHYLEVLQLIPLDWSSGERPDPYLKSLLANRMMPQDRECELALAITFAKENWWHFATFPEDVKKYAELERDKRRREWEQRQKELEQWQRQKELEQWQRERQGRH